QAVVFVAWLLFAMINPWLEEGYWRGLMLDATRHWPRWASNLYSTSLFTLNHPLLGGTLRRREPRLDGACGNFRNGECVGGRLPTHGNSALGGCLSYAGRSGEPGRAGLHGTLHSAALGIGASVEQEGRHVSFAVPVRTRVCGRAGEGDDQGPAHRCTARSTRTARAQDDDPLCNRAT